MKEKQCSKCKQILSEDNFYKSKSKKDGLHNMCKKCHSKYLKEHYLKNIEYYKTKQIKRSRERKPILKRIVVEYKNKPCVDCGCKFDLCAMDFHHIIIKDDNNYIPHLIRSCCSEERLIEEIKKCIVLCACCHRIRHFKKYGDSSTDRTSECESEN